MNFPSKDGEPAELYNPFSATHNQLAEFGEGIYVYFSSIKYFFFVMLCCALLTLPAIRRNEEFNCIESCGVDITMQGSACCATVESLKLWVQGGSDMAVCVLFGLGILLRGLYLTIGRRSINASETVLRTSDFSLVVNNPPANMNAETYQKFFSEWGEVVLVSIVQKNGDLLRKIVEKEILEQDLKQHQLWDAIKKGEGEGTGESWKGQRYCQ